MFSFFPRYSLANQAFGGRPTQAIGIFISYSSVSASRSPGINQLANQANKQGLAGVLHPMHMPFVCDRAVGP